MRTRFTIQAYCFVVLICTLSLTIIPNSAVAQTYTFTTIDDPLGVNGTVAHGISGNDIVGTYWDASNTYHGFLYDGSTWTTIDAPTAALGTSVGGIDGNNVVGYYQDTSSIAHGFLYNRATAAYTTLDDPLTAAPQAVTAANGVSGNYIVGYFVYGHQGGEIGATGYNGFLYNISTSTFNYR